MWMSWIRGVVAVGVTLVAPPPPGPPAMGAMMPGPPQPFSGTLFVPQQLPGT